MGQRIAEKVLLIGWDAADWQMIRPLIAKGWMPTFAKLVDEGVSGNLATIQPVLSPMLWNTIATGKRADKHGICGFVEPKPDRSGIRPVSSTSRQCKAVWNILSQSELNSNVVSWFASHPAEPIRGAVVTDRYVAQASAAGAGRSFPAGTFHPDSLADALAPLVVTARDVEVDALLPFIPRAAEIDQKQDERLLKLANLIARTATVHAAACHLAVHQPWDFMAVYYSAIDQFGHTFMPYHPPRLDGISAQDAAIYGEVMVGCYRFHDMMLESLLSLAGPQTTVVLVSDHGFKSGKNRPGINAWEHPETWHRSFGIAGLHGPGIRQGDALYGGSLLDVIPTILTLFGLPIGNDMDGRPWLEVLDQPVRATRIESWDSLPGDAGQHKADLCEDPADAAESIRQLVALGYLDPPGDDVEETLDRVARDRKINLAVALTGSRRAAEAIPLLEELCREYPAEAGFKLQLASCFMRLGRWDESKQALLQIGPELTASPYAQLMLARLKLHEEGPAEALDTIRRIAGELPREASLLNRAGELFLETQAWRDAETSFRESLALMEDNAVAHHGLAQVFLKQKLFEAAVEQALLAVGLIHYYPAAHFHLGLALYGCGEHAAAISALETCLEMGYRRQETHRQLAELYLFTHSPEKARRHRELAEQPD